MSTVIQLNGVCKSFKHTEILSNVNLTIERGTVVGFRGRNGSGKSVLLKLIAGLYTPDSGEVFIRGEKLGDNIDFPKHLGILVDTPSFIEILSGFDNLRLLAEINGQTTQEDIKRAMQEFGLDPNSRKSVKNYSLGMKQKLGIIQAVMEQQDIILLDEPFNALDDHSTQYLYSFIQRLKQNQSTVILTSHNQDDLDTLCDAQYSLPALTREA